jgi:hypothetical protein
MYIVGVHQKVIRLTQILVQVVLSMRDQHWFKTLLRDSGQHPGSDDETEKPFAEISTRIIISLAHYFISQFPSFV